MGNCDDGIDNDCNGLTDYSDSKCQVGLGDTCSIDIECSTGLCDNDGEQAPDDWHCYDVLDTYFDSLDSDCEFDINLNFDALCDEQSALTDCAFNNSELWCNSSCGAQDRDENQTGCQAFGSDCVSAYSWLPSGEPSVGEYDSFGAVECCGDDAGEFAVSSVCCNNPADCVAGGLCFDGIKELHCYDGLDDDCDGKVDFCDGSHDIGCSAYSGADTDCQAIIQGYVKSQDERIQGATVTALTNFKYSSFSKVINFTAVTDANGWFSITVYGNSTYDLVVKKPGYYMLNGLNQMLNFEATWDINVSLAKDVECNPDCTKGSGSLCYSECNGQNYCSFHSAQTASACDYRPKYSLVELNSTHSVECCEGLPLITPPLIVPEISIAENTSSITTNVMKLVNFRGKTANMHIIILG